MTTTLPDWITVGAPVAILHTVTGTHYTPGTVLAISENGTITVGWDYEVTNGQQQPLAIRTEFVREDDGEYRYRELDGSARYEEVKTICRPDDWEYLDWQLRHEVRDLDVLARQAQRLTYRPGDLIDALTQLRNAADAALTTANLLSGHQRG